MGYWRRLNRDGRRCLGVRARGGDGEGGGDLAGTSRMRSGVPVGAGKGTPDRWGPRDRERERGKERAHRWAGGEGKLVGHACAGEKGEGKGETRAGKWAGTERRKKRRKGGERLWAELQGEGEKGRKGEGKRGRLGWAQRRREGGGERKKKNKKCF
jgi:hypothetical protein